MSDNKSLTDFSRRNFLRTSSLFAISVASGVHAMESLTSLGGGSVSLVDKIDLAYRITNHRSMLNLEFYFINVENDGLNLCKKFKFKYGQEESYMIVRLPQQHIAESWLNLDAEDKKVNNLLRTKKKIDLTKKEAHGFYGNKLNSFTASSNISGYSYLVFQIVFRNPKKISKGKGKVKIKLSSEELLNWNADHFKLVVKQNLEQSVFDIQQGVQGNFENHYPFQENPNQAGKYERTAYPSAYGSPVTAIEAPWRLILSPRLPDHGDYDFHWSFTHEEAISGNTLTDTSKDYHEMWMATLQVRKKPKEKEKQPYLPHQHETIPMELMILGAPDSNLDDGEMLALYKSLGFTERSNNKDHYRILPEPKSKRDLMNLYIAYKLLARTDKMMFTPLGLTARMEMKNTLYNQTADDNADPQVVLYSWIQDMAFGRDQEVQVTEVLVDKNTSLKMLWIKTTKRRVKMGVAYLDYREYIMPLDVKKDYSQKSANISIKRKAQNNVQHIEFTELAPKRILTVENTPANAKEMRGNKLLAIRPLNIQKTPITFGVELTFIKGKKVKTKIEPQLVNTTT